MWVVRSKHLKFSILFFYSKKDVLVLFCKKNVKKIKQTAYVISNVSLFL